MFDTEKQSTEETQGSLNPSTDALTTAVIVGEVALEGAEIISELGIAATVAENILEPVAEAVDVIVEVGSGIVGFIADIVS